MKTACPLQSGAHRVTKITLRVLQKIKQYNQHDYRYGSLLTTVDPLRALRFLRWWMVNRRKWLADADTGLLEISRMIRAASFCSQQTSLHSALNSTGKCQQKKQEELNQVIIMRQLWITVNQFQKWNSPTSVHVENNSLLSQSCATSTIARC